jgi:hypothetical protein
VFALEAMFDSAHSSNYSGSNPQETNLGFELRNCDHVFWQAPVAFDRCSFIS